MDRSNEILSEPNLAYMDAELRLLRLQLEALGDQGERSAETSSSTGQQKAGADSRRDEMSRLQVLLRTMRQEGERQNWALQLPRLAVAFRLNEFERQLLLLAAAPDLDEGFGERIARVQGNGNSWPTVGLAWRLFCASTEACIQSRDSLREDAPLLRFHLVESPATDAPLSEQTLLADRRIADALVGRMMPDARITSVVRISPPGGCGREDWCPEPQLVQHLTEWIRRALAPDGPESWPLIVHLYGASAADLEALAGQVVATLGLPMLAASTATMPAALVRLFARESVLLPAALFVETATGEPLQAYWVSALADAGPITFIASERPLRAPAGLSRHNWLPVEVPRPDARQRQKLWENALAAVGASGNGEAAALADNFELGASEIRQAARTAARLSWLRGEPPNAEDAAAACRMESQHRMSELAQRLSALYGWDDLLLPADSSAKLRELCAQVRCQQTVLSDYGFANSLSRGRGVTALFAGPSGTGKTMAAEVVARDLGRELYRVDLARVVSKYIGETEKNLRQVFEEAERARCVVLFDEADALFGRRTEVRDSHDRYANIEVSYLLQWLEETQAAVVLLATNRREAIDEAFLRRFRFLVEFPLPSPELRRELWKKSFPAAAPVEGVRFDKVADRLPLSGANIRNIALSAAYAAAADGGVVGPSQVAHGMRRELEKLGRSMPVQETDLREQDEPRGGRS